MKKKSENESISVMSKNEEIPTRRLIREENIKIITHMQSFLREMKFSNFFNTKYMLFTYKKHDQA